MDGLAGVATLITVAATALQSTKFLYETVTGIQDGPVRLEQLGSDLHTLQRNLQQITALSRDPAQTNLTDFSALTSLSQQCAADVQKMEQKIKELCSGKKIERAWNRLKTHLHSRDLDSMRTRIRYHVQTLTAALGVATICDIGQMDTSIQQSFASSASQHDLLSDEVKMISRHQVDSIRYLSDRSSEYHLMMVKTMADHHQSLNRVHHTVEALEQTTVSREALLEQAVRSAQMEARHIADAMASMSHKLDSSRSISRDQYETLQRMLGQVLEGQKSQQSFDPYDDRLADLSKTTATGGFKGNAASEEDTSIPSQPPSERLLESVDRLWKLGSIEDTIFFSEDAENVIDDLEALLSAASESITKPKPDVHGKRKREDTCDQDNLDRSQHDNQRGLTRVRGLLTSSQSLHVTKNAQKQRPMSRRRYNSVQNWCKHAQLPTGGLTITYRLERYKDDRKSTKYSSFLACGNDELLELFTSTVTLIPTDKTVRAKMFARFVQRVITKGFFSMHPTLSFYSMIRKDSAVFSVIANGDMEELERMFREKETSVTDCDPDGRSLLNYAFYHTEAKLCKFLLERGADPNPLERGRDINYDYLRPLLLYSNLLDNGLDLDSEVNFREFERRLECERLLLNAGSDPLLKEMFADESMASRSEGDYLSSHVMGMLRHGGIPVELLIQVIDHDEVCFDVEEQDEKGNTALLQASDAYEGGIRPDTIRLLLQRGAKVNAYNNMKQMCFHLALHNSSWQTWNDKYEMRLRDSLALLVEADADIHAVDRDGHSVSEYAIDFKYWDVWIAVLKDCGKDVDQVYMLLRRSGWTLPGDAEYEKLKKSWGFTKNMPKPPHGHKSRFQNSIDQLWTDSDSDESMGGVELDWNAENTPDVGSLQAETPEVLG